MRINEIAPGEKAHIIGISDDKVNRFYSLVEQNCSEALAAMKNTETLLYRGIRQSPPAMFHGKSRDNRNPLDSETKTQLTIDFYLSNSGFTALRSNSIFCTSKSSVTKGYGTMYLIFPINGFEFTWSKVIEDLIFSKLNGIMGDDPNLVANYKFKNTDFAGALSSGHEMYIRGEYYACDVATFGNEIFNKIFRNNV